MSLFDLIVSTGGYVNENLCEEKGVLVLSQKLDSGTLLAKINTKITIHSMYGLYNTCFKLLEEFTKQTMKSYLDTLPKKNPLVEYTEEDVDQIYKICPRMGAYIRKIQNECNKFYMYVNNTHISPEFAVREWTDRTVWVYYTVSLTNLGFVPLLNMLYRDSETPSVRWVTSKDCISLFLERDTNERVPLSGNFGLLSHDIERILHNRTTEMLEVPVSLLNPTPLHYRLAKENGCESLGIFHFHAKDLVLSTFYKAWILHSSQEYIQNITEPYSNTYYPSKEIRENAKNFIVKVLLLAKNEVESNEKFALFVEIERKTQEIINTNLKLLGSL